MNDYIETSPWAIVHGALEAIQAAQKEVRNVACKDLEDRAMCWDEGSYCHPSDAFLLNTMSNLYQLQDLLVELSIAISNKREVTIITKAGEKK